MLKFITTKNVTYKGKLYRGRKIIGTEDTLALIYPLIGKAIFTWGWRSKAEQAEMVKKGVSKTMDSNHRRGVAYDIYNWKEMEAKMNKLGFINDLKPWDPGHFPLGGEKKARKNFSLIDALPKKLEEYKPKKPESVFIPITIIPVVTSTVSSPIEAIDGDLTLNPEVVMTGTLSTAPVAPEMPPTTNEKQKVIPNPLWLLILEDLRDWFVSIFNRKG